MTWKNIRLILLREVRDQLRDRRTLFMVVVLPLLLYPGLGVGMLQMAMYFREQPRQVVVLGVDELPELALIEEGQFSRRWFRNPDTADKLRVVTDSDSILSDAAVSDDDRKELLEAAVKVRELVARRNEMAAKLAPWDPQLIDELPGVQAAALRAQVQKDNATAKEKPPEIERLEAEFKELKAEIGEAFSGGKLQVLMVVPEGFGENLKAVDRLLADKSFDSEQLHELPLLRPIVVRNRANEKSDVAYRRVREALEKWEKQLLKDRLELAHLPETVPDPVSVLAIDVANEGEIANSVWSKIFPALLVIMALTGAFYPAIDVASGEKERGTMETLLICPATRSEIVIGKFLTVLLFSMATTVLNLISMGFTGQYIVSMTAKASAGAMGSVPLPTPLALMWLVLLLIPLAAFYSALCLALATFARSNKEGQYYLTPLFMVTMGLTMFSMSPSIELAPTAPSSLFYCAVPIVGPSLLLKALLSNPGDTGVLVFGLPVLMSSIGYSLLALWWAVEQFKSEDVLFRADERFDLRLWLRHLLRDKESLPTSAQAASCFILMMLLQFLSIRFVGGAFAGVAPEDMGRKVMQLAVIQQISLILAPALFMAILFTKNVRKTLRLTWPGATMLAAALALPVVLHPLAIELLGSLREFFPQLPEGAKAAFATMADDSIPLLFIIGTFALTPAICEEVAFRGFILSGFGRTGRVGIAIVLSSVTFGIIHMIPQQVFNATLVGLVLGLIAVRSGSLLPGVIFHLAFNSLAVLHGQASAAISESSPGSLESGPLSWFVSLQQDPDAGAKLLRYEFPTLVICAAVAFILIRWLIRMPADGETGQALPADASLPLNSQPTATAG